MRFKMSNIYIPIDFSDLKSAIPPEQEIIYSTYAEVAYRGLRPYYASDAKELTRRGFRQYKAKWNTHVLITSKGLAFEIHYKYKTPLQTYYLPLYHSAFLLKKYIITILDEIIGSSHALSLLRVPDFEDYDTFKKRSKEFKSFLKPFILTEMTEMLKESYPYFENNPDYTYSEYLTTHESPMNKLAFHSKREHIKRGGSLEQYVEYFEKKMGK